MRIESINFINSEDVPLTTRNTKANAAVTTIMETLAKATQGKSLIVAASDIKKFERYALQKTLQKRGAKVLVSNGNHPTTGKPCLFVKRLTDKEWNDWQSSGAEVKKAPAKK
jgi:hypothetical protein